MPLQIRQIVIAASNLSSTVTQLESILGLQTCHHDPGVAEFGLKNALMPITNTHHTQFLEVVAPTKPNTAATRHLTKHGDSGYMLLLQTDNLTRDRQRLTDLNVRIVWQASHPDISAIHLHPRDIGATIVSLDQPDPPESWRWAGPDWQQYPSSNAQRVTGVEISAQDPAAMAQRWSQVLGTPAPTTKAGEHRITLSDGTLVFIPGEHNIISGFYLQMRDPAAALERAQQQGLAVQGSTVQLCGVRMHFEAEQL